jgi:hypothetical protein
MHAVVSTKLNKPVPRFEDVAKDERDCQTGVQDPVWRMLFAISLHYDDTAIKGRCARYREFFGALADFYRDIGDHNMESVLRAAEREQRGHLCSASVTDIVARARRSLHVVRVV